MCTVISNYTDVLNNIISFFKKYMNMEDRNIIELFVYGNWQSESKQSPNPAVVQSAM